MQVEKQQLELDMEQWTGSKLGKEDVEAMYCHPAYLTYMQSTFCEMPGWMKHKLESRLLGDEIRNKTGVPTLTTTIQHSFGSVGHSNQGRKRSKRNPDRKRRSETLIACR